MKVNLKSFLDTWNVSLEDIAGYLGMFIADNEVIPQGTVTLKKFEQTVGQYISESLEAGENPEYILAKLASEHEDQEILREMLYEEINNLGGTEMYNAGLISSGGVFDSGKFETAADVIDWAKGRNGVYVLNCEKTEAERPGVIIKIKDRVTDTRFFVNEFEELTEKEAINYIEKEIGDE